MKAKKKIIIKEKDIKYTINNTELPVVITKDNKVYFDVDPKDEKSIINQDPDKIAEYQEKVNKTMEYLYLEGFLQDPESNEE